MLYDLKNSKVEQGLSAKRMKRSGVMPKRPTLLPGTIFYYSAFYALDGDRLRENAFIPWTALIAYFDRCGLPKIMEDEFIYIMGQADGEYLKAIAQRMKDETKLPTKGKRGKR